MYRLPLFALPLLALPLLVGCDATSPDETPVRFVHAAPGAPPVSFFLGDLSREMVAFGQTVPYNRVDVGEQTVRVRSALDASRRYLDQLVRVERRLPATFVLLDTAAALPYVYLADDTLAADARQLRLAHGALDAGPLDIFEADAQGTALGDRPIVRGLAFRGNTGFVGLGAGVDGLVAVSPVDPSLRYAAVPSEDRATLVLVRVEGGLQAVAVDEAPPPDE